MTTEQRNVKWGWVYEATGFEGGLCRLRLTEG